MDLYILCYIAVLEFVLIGRTFIMKLINLNLYFLKITILATLYIDFCIKIFLNKLHHCKQSISTVPKKDIFLVLPFLGPTSLEIRTRLRILFRKKLPFYNLRIIFRSSCRLKTFFHFKYRIPKYLRSGLVYKFKCAGCIATYYGKTKRHFKVRACEHLGISPLTGKRVSSVFQSTAIKDHLLFCQHSPSLDDYSILCSESNDLNSDGEHFN